MRTDEIQKGGMKAAIMVGDHVTLFDKYPAKVECIGDTEVYLLDDDGVHWHVPYKFIRPVTITLEILTRNGFAEAKHSKRPSFQLIDGHTYAGWWNGRLNMQYNPFPGERPSNYIHIDCRFVHQLQHAIRLCGIEKEIIL